MSEDAKPNPLLMDAAAVVQKAFVLGAEQGAKEVIRLVDALERAREDLAEIGHNCDRETGCGNCRRVEEASARIVDAIAKARGGA